MNSIPNARSALYSLNTLFDTLPLKKWKPFFLLNYSISETLIQKIEVSSGVRKILVYEGTLGRIVNCLMFNIYVVYGQAKYKLTCIL